MASNQRIDDLVSPKSYEQLEKLVSDLGLTNGALIEAAKSAKKFVDTLAGARTMQQVARDSQKAAQDLERLNRLQAQAVLAEEKVNTERAKRAGIEQRTAASIERTTQRQERQAQQEEKSAQKAKKLADAYFILNEAYKETVELARNVGAQFGVNSKQFQDAAKSANFLREKLDDIDKPLGNYQRNVGNYESATNKFQKRLEGLGQSFTQLTRELPAFTNSVQTGLLGISNNLPIVFDEIARVNAVLKETNIAQAQAAGEQAKETALAGGASEEAATQIGELAKSTALAAAEGQRGKAAFQAIAKSLLSFQTLLSVGVTLLTIYGPMLIEYISSLFKGSKALTDFTERQKAFNEAFKSANREIGEQTAKLKILYEAATDASNSDKNRLAAVRELQKEFPKTFGNLSQEVILLGQASAAYKEETKNIEDNAKARAIANKIGELAAKQLDAEVQIQKIRNANANEIAGREAEAQRKVAQTSERGRKLVAQQQSFITDFFRQESNKRAQIAIQEQEGIKKSLQGTIDLILKVGGGSKNIAPGLISNSGAGKDTQVADALRINRALVDAAKIRLELEQGSFDDRLAALQVYEIESKKLIDKEEQIKLSQEGVNAEQRTAIAIEANNRRLELEKDVADRRIKLNQDAEKALTDIFKKGIAEQNQILENSKGVQEQYLSQSLQDIQDNANDALLALSQQYAQGLIDTEEYQRIKANIEAQASRDSIQAQIDAFKLLINVQKELGIDVTDSERKIAELQRKLSKETTDAKIADVEREKEARKKLNEAIKSLANEAAEFGFDLLTRGGEVEKERLQQQSEQIDANNKKEIEAIQRSLGTEEEKAAKIAIINAQGEAQKNAIAARQRQIDRKQAQFEKARSIAQIIQNTATAVTEALPNFILAAIVGALGAIQLGRVIAQPIPAYAKGTDHHKGGLMIWGEAGQELAIEPSGKTYLSPNKATLASAPVGTQIISNPDLVRLLATPERPNYSGAGKVDLSINELQKIRKAIQGQTVNAVNITKGGWRKQQTSVEKYNQYRKNHFN